MNDQNDALQPRDSLQDYPALKSGKNLIVWSQSIALNDDVIGADYSRRHLTEGRMRHMLKITSRGKCQRKTQMSVKTLHGMSIPKDKFSAKNGHYSADFKAIMTSFGLVPCLLVFRFGSQVLMILAVGVCLKDGFQMRQSFEYPGFTVRFRKVIRVSNIDQTLEHD